MDLKTYQDQALTTMADQYGIHQRLVSLGPQAVQLNNGLTGLTNEVGEIADVVKAYIEYGRPLQIDGKGGLREEVGDALWRLSQICDAAGLTMEECAEANLVKLGIRYEDGFTDEKANNRDLIKEGEALGETRYDLTQTGQGWSEPPEEIIAEDGTVMAQVDNPEPPIKGCPHGSDPADCDECDRQSDFAFDSFRENR